MYILYYHPYSQHVRRVVALLEEAKLPYETRSLALEAGEHLTPEYRAMNPNCQVPTLLDGDVKIYESNAILRYLCLKHELESWYPSQLNIRALVEQWLDWNQCRLAQVVVDIVLNKVFMGDKGDQAAIAGGLEKLTTLAEVLSEGLKNRQFLAGDTPTIADLSVASNIFQLSLAQAAPQQPNITAWFERIGKIEGFQKALPKA